MDCNECHRVWPFVNVGLHQDGLVHVRELSDHFVKDPAEVVKEYQKVKVRVLVEEGRSYDSIFDLSVPSGR